MSLHHNLEKTSHLFLGCLLSASISTTAYSAQVRLDSEPTVIDEISLPTPIITTISEDTGTVGDGITSDDTLKIHGTASTNSVVEVMIDGVAVGTTVTDDVGKWVFDYTETALTIGSHTIIATTIDSYGKTTNPSTTFNLVIESSPEETTDDNPIPSHATLDLIVAFGGSGDGSVTSSPKGITCSSKTGGCRYTFEGTDDTITLDPVAADNSRFTNWGGHDDCRDGKISVTGGEKFCMAYFTQDNPLEITLSIEKTGTGQGTITAEGIDCGKDCRETYSKDTQLTLTATATEGSQFEGWAGDCTGTSIHATVTMDVGKNCLVQFNTMPSPVAISPPTEEVISAPEEEVTSTPEADNNNSTEEQATPLPEPAILPAPSEDKRACPPERLLNYTCNARGQTVQDLQIADTGGLGNLSNAVVTGTIYNQGWVSNLVIKETGTVIGGIVSGSIKNQGKMIDIEFRGERISGGVLAGRILNTSKIGGIIENVTLAAGTHLSGGHVGGTISGDATEPALLENLTVMAGSVLENVLLGKGIILPTQLTLGHGVQTVECTENNVKACLTKQQCQDVGGDWNAQTTTCIEKVSTAVTEVEALCSSTQLSACTTSATCQEAGGQWTKGICESSRSTEIDSEPATIEENPPHCATLTYQEACEAINGVYTDGQCQLLPTCKSQSIMLKPSGEKEANSATFACGLAVGQGQYTRVPHLFPDQPMSIRCNVKVDPTHIGQQANLVVFGCYEGLKTFFNTCVTEFCWMMDKRNGTVDVLHWDRTPGNLVPFEENVVLTERIVKELYAGTFQATGYLNIFFGYQLKQGDIVYSLHPIDVTIHSNYWWLM